MLNTLQQYFNDRNYTVFSDDESLGVLRAIHPLKVPIVERLVELLCDNADLVVVFGSSVTCDHHLRSDLDVAIIPGKAYDAIASELYKFDPEIEVDVVAFDSFEDIVKQADDVNSACHDILYCGVPVYSKKFPINFAEA